MSDKTIVCEGCKEEKAAETITVVNGFPFCPACVAKAIKDSLGRVSAAARRAGL